MRAVNHAHVVLSWQENLTEDEIPPEWMWSLDDELETWFDDVKEARKEKWGGGRGRERDREVPMMQNELARNRRRR